MKKNIIVILSVIVLLFTISLTVKAEEGETITIRPSSIFTLDDIVDNPSGNGLTEVEIEIETELDIGSDYTLLPKNKKPITIYSIEEIDRTEELVSYKLGIIALNDTNLYYTYFSLPISDSIDVNKVRNFKNEINIKHYFDEELYKHYLYYQKDLTKQCSIFEENEVSGAIQYAENLMIINLTDLTYTTLKKGKIFPYFSIEDGIGYIYLNIKDISLDYIVSLDIEYSYQYRYWFGVVGETFTERHIYRRNKTYEFKNKLGALYFYGDPIGCGIDLYRMIKNFNTPEIQMVTELPLMVEDLYIDNIGSKPEFTNNSKWVKVALRHFPRLSKINCNGVILGEDLVISDMYYIYEGQLFIYEEPDVAPVVQFDYDLDFNGFFKDLFKKNFFGYTLPKYYKEFIICLIGLVGIVFILSKLFIVFRISKNFGRRYRRY